MFLGVRLRVRLAVGEIVYRVIERTTGTDRDLEPDPVQRGPATPLKTLQLRTLVRHRTQNRVFADRCGQPLLRLWLLGVEVNASEDGRHVELGSGRVLALDVANGGSSRVIRAVPAGSDGPQLALW